MTRSRIRGTVTPTAMAVAESALSSTTGSGNYIRFLLQSKFESIKHDLNNKKTFEKFEF